VLPPSRWGWVACSPWSHPSRCALNQLKGRYSNRDCAAGLRGQSDLLVQRGSAQWLLLPTQGFSKRRYRNTGRTECIVVIQLMWSTRCSAVLRVALHNVKCFILIPLDNKLLVAGPLMISYSGSVESATSLTMTLVVFSLLSCLCEVASTRVISVYSRNQRVFSVYSRTQRVLSAVGQNLCNVLRNDSLSNIACSSDKKHHLRIGNSAWD